MRKAVKFKALVFIIAWTAIFMHNMIPHNHVDEVPLISCHLAHDVDNCPVNGADAARISEQHHDDHVCHLSNLLYQSPDPEIFLSDSSINPDFIPDLPASKNYTKPGIIICSSGIAGTNLLRAPPFA